MAEHKLKTVNPHFNDVWVGKKTFEIRNNDRNFKVGDTVVLKEFDPVGVPFSGRIINATITHILDDLKYCKEGHVAFSFEIINRIQP